MADIKIEVGAAVFLLGLIGILAAREWFVEIVTNDLTAFLRSTPLETWFILAVVCLGGAILLGWKK